MATTGLKGQLATTSVPAGTSLVPLEARRKYSLSDQFIFKDIEEAPFLAAMTRRLRRKAVDDPKFKLLEDEYPRMAGTISGCDIAGTAAALLVTTDYALIPYAREFLQPGDRLQVPKEQTDQTSTTAYIFGEVIEIAQVINGASASLDYCQIIRANGAGGANTYGITADSGDTLNFYKLGNAFREGAAAPEAFTNAMSIIYNYTEIKKEAVDITSTMQSTVLYGPQNELQYKRMKKRKELMRYVERVMLTGQRGIKTEAGKPKRYTGGLFWWIGNGSAAYTSWSTANDMIAGNGTSRIWKVTDTDDNTLWSRDKIFEYILKMTEYGSRRNKITFVGDGFMYKFNILFENMIRLTNMVNKFGLMVMEFHTPKGILNLYPHAEMTHSGHTNMAFTADMDYLGYVYLSAKGKNRDIHLQKSIQAPDVDGEKDQWIGELGFNPGFWEAHSAIILP